MQKLIISLILAYIAGLLLGHGFWYFPYSTGTNVIHGIITAGIFVRLDKLFLRRVQTTILPCLIGSAAYIYSAV